MKLMIFLGVIIGGTIGGWIGALMTNNNWLSAASILLSALGSLIGLWAGFKAGQYFE